MEDNIHTLRDALEWLDRRIREEAELDDEMSNEHAIQLGFITNMLEKFPLRQCDVGTAEEQAKRWEQFCTEHHEPWKPGVPAIFPQICKCPCYRTGQCNMFVWSQMPYAQEGGAK